MDQLKSLVNVLFTFDLAYNANVSTASWPVALKGHLFVLFYKIR